MSRDKSEKMHKSQPIDTEELLDKNVNEIGDKLFIKTACGRWQYANHIAINDSEVTCKHCLGTMK